MKNLLRSAIFSIICLSGTAQNSLNDIASVDPSGNWWSFNYSSNITPSIFFDTYPQSMGYGDEYSFVLLNEKEDNIGLKHQRYAQQYSGITIEGAQFLLHIQNNRIIKANGRLVKGIQSNTQPSIDFNTALSIAKKLSGAKSFYWEDPNMEAWIKDVKNDASATFYPKNELVLIDPQFSQNGDNYKLAYKLDLFFEATDDHATYYIDAHNGELIWEQNECHSANTVGQAQTRYHGLRNIVTDSVSSSKYILNDNTRGGGIQTFNAQTGTSIAGSVDFEDSDNYWNNANAQLDDAATDAHWGAGFTYDYFLSQHGRDSYDDQGSKIVSYVHWDQGWFNARLEWHCHAIR